MNRLIKKIEEQINNPSEGLPDEVFYFIGRITPFINVDLLIKDPSRGILMTWRNDEHSGQGWHLPGGIIRFRESIKHRVNEVARLELNSKINKISKNPLRINQIINPLIKERSHFISLLYKCNLTIDSDEQLSKTIELDNNLINYFKKIPNNILKNHLIYSDLFEN
jgi:hypothetical protein